MRPLKSIKPYALVLPITFLLSPSAQSQEAWMEESATRDNIEEITIIGLREDRKSQGATGLDLSMWETPQSLTIIESDTMEKFGLSDINSLLKLTTGVNVDSTETDRTYYNSRGFDITSMHVDGVGLPFGVLVVGDLDTAIYEKVEIIRGSNGLITGLGNPSGTINYVRKRPTNDFEGSVQLTAGTWDNLRAEVDVSTPLNESGTWAARAVGVYQDKESWLDNYKSQRDAAYFVVDGQVTSSMTLAAGYTQQSNNSDGVLWGAIPALYNDGTPIDNDVSSSTAMEWTYWNTDTEEVFTELGWQLNDDWRMTASARYTESEERAELFYAYWIDGVNPDTGLGLYGFPGQYPTDEDRLMLDISLDGTFSAWGQNHQLRVGVSSAERNTKGYSLPAFSGFDALPSFPGWTGQEIARPTWGDASLEVDEEETLDRLYSFLNLSITDSFNLILGASFVDYNKEGVSFGLSTNSTEDGSNPYIGFTWELAEGLNAYGSFSDIYQPQYVLGADLQPLGSAEGDSYELGLKKVFSNNSLISLALFRSEQTNLEEFADYSDGDNIDDTDYSDDFTYAIYRGIDVESEGFEVEFTGKLSDAVSLHASYTQLSLDLAGGDDARPFIPRKTAKLLLSYIPENYSNLELGLSSRWQSDIYVDTAFGRLTQDSYAILGGYANYNVNENLSFALNLDNISDEKYFSSLKFDQVFYAAPRSAKLTMNYKF